MSLTSGDELMLGAEAFADGAPVLVGDPGDPIVFIAAAADRIDGERLQQVQELAGGITLLGLTGEHAARLALAPLPGTGGRVAAARPDGLRLTAPIDAAGGHGGWSLPGRAHTMRVAADPASRPEHLAMPGHVHPARIDPDATPAACAALELAVGCGHAPVLALAAVAGYDGTPVTLQEARSVAALRRLATVSSSEIRAQGLLRRTAGVTIECEVPTRDGRFRAVALDDELAHDADRGSALALVHGDLAARDRPLVHVHAACLLGDAFGSLLCDCGARLRDATDEILAAGAGVIVYMKPGISDPARRYHCARQAPLDLAQVIALLTVCGVDPGSVL